MGNCLGGSSYVNKVSSTAKPETEETPPPKIQTPSERDRSEDHKLPSNPVEVEALRRGASSAVRNPLVAFSFAELKKVASDFRRDALIGGGGFRARVQGQLRARRRRRRSRGRRQPVSPRRGGEGARRRQQLPRPTRVAGGGDLPGAAVAPEPGEAGGVLLRGRAPRPGVRVHAAGQRGVAPLLPPDVSLVGGVVGAAVGGADADRAGRGARSGVPARRGASPRDLPRLQDVQHPAGRRVQREAVGLRPRQGRAGGGAVARVHAGHGHLRLRGAGVHDDGPPHGLQRRVQLRRRAAGAAHGAAVAGPVEAREGAGARGLGAPGPAAQEEGHGHPRPEADGGSGSGRGRRRRAASQGRAQDRHARLPLPQPKPQGEAAHARRRRLARAAAAPTGGARRRLSRRWNRRDVACLVVEGGMLSIGGRPTALSSYPWKKMT